MPARLTSPTVGLSPTMPQCEAGDTIEPSVSVPIAKAQRLADTPEPDGNGSLLDNTTIIWTNELGKGNNHTLNGIPFVLVGGGCGFRMGRTVKFDHLPHNRLWISLAHSMGHEIATFGNPNLSRGGVVEELF